MSITLVGVRNPKWHTCDTPKVDSDGKIWSPITAHSECDELENVKYVYGVQGLVKEIRHASNRGRPRDELGGLSRLVVLSFHAPWCRACRAVHTKLLRLAEENPRVLFISVDASKSSEIVEALGVETLPYIQFYDATKGVFGGECVSIKPQKIEALRQTIAQFDVPKCDIQHPLLPEKLIELYDKQCSRSIRCR